MLHEVWKFLTNFYYLHTKYTHVHTYVSNVHLINPFLLPTYVCMYEKKTLNTKIATRKFISNNKHQQQLTTSTANPQTTFQYKNKKKKNKRNPLNNKPTCTAIIAEQNQQ